MLTVTIKELNQGEGIGTLNFHGANFKWTCSGGRLEIVNPARLTEDQVIIVSSMAMDVVRSMESKGGDNHSGKVMSYGKKDWNGTNGFDHLPEERLGQ